MNGNWEIDIVTWKKKFWKKRRNIGCMCLAMHWYEIKSGDIKVKVEEERGWQTHFMNVIKGTEQPFSSKKEESFYYFYF